MKSYLLPIVMISLSPFLFGQSPGAGVTDIDGNSYETVIIGSQEWMSENLRVSRFNNGDTIENEPDDFWWQIFAASPHYRIYDNNPVNDSLYGKLYNWYCIDDSRGLCPTGWHIPSDSEWHQLTTYIDSNAVLVTGTESTFAGGQLKELDTLFWSEPNVQAFDSYNFHARGGGLVYDNGYNNFLKHTGSWWTSTEKSQSVVWIRNMFHFEERLSRGSQTAYFGMSARCINNDLVALEEILPFKAQKTVVKIIDLTGRETEHKPNTLLIYIYDDGSVEKVFQVE